VFFVSGVIHMAGDAMVTGRIIFSAFTFFMLQPFGITIELLIVHIWHQFSGSQDKPTTVDDFDVGDKLTSVKSAGKEKSRFRRCGSAA